MTATRDRGRAHSDAGFDGPTLLSEQTALLLDSSPAEINFIYFLKLRLSAQQRSTAQRNYWRRVHQKETDVVKPNMTGGQIRGGVVASTAQTSTAVDDSGILEASVSGAETFPYHGGGAGRNWHISGSAESTFASAHDALRAGSEYLNTPLGGPSSRETLTLETPQGFAPHLTAHQRSFEVTPSAVSNRRCTPTPEATEFAFLSAGESSDGGVGHRRIAFGPPPREDVHLRLLSTTSSYNATAAAAIDERPAMACGKPQVPMGVDEMKDVVLVPCPHCGRTFAPSRLERHAIACERHKGTVQKMSEVRNTKGLSGLKRSGRTAAAPTATDTANTASFPPAGFQRLSS
ncbi:hypothetical protein JKF63_00649 [Porcisia hertigi]|uniref:C2HC/C3H-type domain-containing protein n=1 Tax=Porcisia hertigi TaxID=2761500 RepID=A0A836HDH3_9TRYP|nr:hypothetical protein JKF63_00649 [Porcisia hertigi]